jgi:hypothetical protein
MLKVTPNGSSHQSTEYMITRSELFMLREEGVISTKAYVYFALSLDYPEGPPKTGLNIAAFCWRWEICEADFLNGIAFLARKGILTLKTNSLQMDSADRAERRTKAEIKRESRSSKKEGKEGTESDTPSPDK